MGIIGWIIIGGLAGWVASKIVGGLIGGFLLGVFNVDTEGSGIIISFITALIGACLLLFVVKAVTKRA